MSYFQDTPVSQNFFTKHTETKLLYNGHSAESSIFDFNLENKVFQKLSLSKKVLN